MKEITSIEITNPIEIGSSVTAKTFSLDIRLILNQSTVINLEMQVLNKGFWPERSIGYLARSFDNLKHGENYDSTKSVIHIGFLDFDLPDIPAEFYSTYKLLNVRNHAKYSDEFTLSVINLKHIDMATDDDKKYCIDKWAALFKATTWEEVKMIAGKDQYLNEASAELFKRLADLGVQEECEAREQYYKEKQYLIELRQEIAETKKDLAKKNQTIAMKNQAIAKKDQDIAMKNQDIARKNEAIDNLSAENLQLKKLLEQNNISISF